ncbi:MAG: hypothetical protein JSS35_04905, partial [Proteobacteria bacterium]|nr:hypothetical protein [Pseudomonadota bacterium]
MPRARSKPAPMADPAAEHAAPPAVEPAPAPVAAAEPEILQRLDTPARWSWALVAGGVVLAAGLSVFAVRGAMRKGGKRQG